MILDVATNAAKDEAAEVLVSVGHGLGVADEMRELLAKAGGGGPARRPPPDDHHPEEAREPIVRVIMERWRGSHTALRKVMAGNLGRLGGVFRAHVLRRAAGSRATAADVVHEMPWLLALSRETIVQSYGALVDPLAGWRMPEDIKEALDHAGIRVPVVTVATLQTAAFNAGAYATNNNGAEAWPELLPELEARERAALEPAEIALARQFAHVRAGAALAHLAAGVSDQVAGREIDLIREGVGAFMTRQITEEGWARLRTNLQDALLRDPLTHEHAYDRDMDRLAASETRWAYNAGRVAALMEAGVATVRYAVSPTACKECRRLLLEEDGSPRIFPIADIVAQVRANGGLNVGRAVAEWRPGLLIHPWCQCRPERADIPQVPWRPTS